MVPLINLFPYHGDLGAGWLSILNVLWRTCSSFDRTQDWQWMDPGYVKNCVQFNLNLSLGGTCVDHF